MVIFGLFTYMYIGSPTYGRVHMCYIRRDICIYQELRQLRVKRRAHQQQNQQNKNLQAAAAAVW